MSEAMSSGGDRAEALTGESCSYHNELAVIAPLGAGRASIAARRNGKKTVATHLLAVSPLRLLTPRNHGDSLWVFFANLGGGLVDGDCLDVRVDLGPGSTVVLGTQASTKVYRSPHGCSQRIEVTAAGGAAVAMLPDPVVCYKGARYAQQIHVSMAEDASLLLLDGYTCGRSARGERWQFDRFAAKTTVVRGGKTQIVDAVRLDSRDGSVAERMGRFDVMLTLIAMGPRFAPVREALREAGRGCVAADSTVVAVSPIGADTAVARVAAERFESGSHALRCCFSALARVLGDDPFARKW
jgi:urease accessory protein